MTRLYRFMRCLFRGHADHLFEFWDAGEYRPTHLSLICVDCGRISPGWEMGK